MSSTTTATFRISRPSSGGMESSARSTSSPKVSSSTSTMPPSSLPGGPGGAAIRLRSVRLPSRPTRAGRTDTPAAPTRSPGRGAGGAGPKAQSEPGSRVASMFFDRYPRFYETSATSPYHGRLNLRYEAIFAENRDVFAGARVLDIASHDGRWSLAALETGAASVVGIEAKADLVAHAEDNLAGYGIAADRFTFLAGDVFDVLAKESPAVDVVLCLGYLYHTLRYNELLKRIHDLGARFVILDTEVHRGGKEALVKIRRESVHREGNAVPDEFSHGDSVLTSRPNVKALRTLMRAYDFELEGLSDWGGLIRDNPGETGVDDYAARQRVTARCRAIAP